MKKIVRFFLFSVVIFLSLAKFNVAQAKTIQTTYPIINYTVVPGDSLWKISVKFQVGLTEIAEINPHISNTSIIVPGEVIKIPDLSKIKAIENEVIRLVNVERAKKGIAPLKNNWQLSRVARYKSEDMNTKNYFSHISPTFGSPFVMMKNFGINFSAAGENIAKGQNTASEVVTSWMNSPGHRANILNPSFTEIGVGIAKTNSFGYIWSQMFIGR